MGRGAPLFLASPPHVTPRSTRPQPYNPHNPRACGESRSSDVGSGCFRLAPGLKLNGDAIHGTRPWRQSSEGNVRYTSKGGLVYAIAEGRPGRNLHWQHRSPHQEPRSLSLARTTHLSGMHPPEDAHRDSGSRGAEGELRRGHLRVQTYWREVAEVVMTLRGGGHCFTPEPCLRFPRAHP